MELILCGNLFLTSNGGKAISFIAESPKFCQKTLVSHLLSKSPLQPKNGPPFLSSYCCIYFSKDENKVFTKTGANSMLLQESLTLIE